MPSPTEPTYLRPAIATAFVSAFSGLLVTCVFVSFGWLQNRSDSFGGVIEGGVRAWLVSHGSGITAQGVQVAAIPLGATMLVIALMFWVTLKILEDPLEEVGPFIAIVAGTYGVLAGALSLATTGDDYSTNLVRSAIGGFLVAAIGSGIGVAVRNGGLATLISAMRLPAGLFPAGNAEVKVVVRASSRGIAALLAPALAIVIILFALHIDRASDLWASLSPGTLGSIGLAGVCLMLIPNLVLWTASVLIGPGFALGTDTSVDLTGSHLGAVPGLPILASLPGPGEFAGWVFLLGLIPLAAGAFAGWHVKPVAARSQLSHIGLGAASGALAGLACGVLIALSGGSVGPGRMADAGPPPVTPALVAIAVLALGGAIGAALGHYRVTRAHNSPVARPHLWSRHKSPSID
ncbi:MAG: DUF6350 family protein [Aeromicrobium sp.]